MCLIGCDLARLEALVGMVRYIASGLAEAELSSVELVAGTLDAAVDAGRVVQLLSLILVCSVCDDISECLPLFLSVLTLCLFRVRYILERSICSASDVPYLSHSHYPSPRFGLRNSISIAF